MFTLYLDRLLFLLRIQARENLRNFNPFDKKDYEVQKYYKKLKKKIKECNKNNFRTQDL